MRLAAEDAPLSMDTVGPAWYTDGRAECAV